MNDTNPGPEIPNENAERASISLLLTDLARFTERTYGRARMKEAWDEFNRWKTPPSAAIWTHAEFFHAWLFWDWTPDMNDASLDSSIAREHSPAEHYLSTHGSRLSSFSQNFLERSVRSRFSFHQFNRVNGRPHLRNLLTQENVATFETNSREGELHFGLLISLPGQEDHPWFVYAPDTLGANALPVIHSYRQALLGESPDVLSPEFLRAYAVETFDIYINLRQEQPPIEAAP
jgi:hypothetical protein